MTTIGNIKWFNELSMGDVNEVGGKNASLGEMINGLASSGVFVPNGFATTSHAFREFLKQSGLAQKIYTALEEIDIEDVEQLAKTGAQIRQWIVETPFLPSMLAEVSDAYEQLEAATQGTMAVAVRSSATAEDLPNASFAGQQETFLNVRGLDQVLDAIKQVYASLFNDRAIAYRVHQGFEHDQVAISAGIQHMVRSDIGASGVAFSIDTESGFSDVVFITAAYGLGETVVQGAVNPDEYYVHKPNLANNLPAVLRRTLGSKALKMIYADDNEDVTTKTVELDAGLQRTFVLSDDEITTLAQHVVTIEQHYGCPMDVEWARDGNDGKIYIVQARPETVKSQSNGHQLEHYQLKDKGRVVVSGRSIGQKMGRGKACVMRGLHDMTRMQAGDVLVADMTDPDWEPIMKRAFAIVTNRGGRTCHAAIIARELGIPAVVGCGDALDKIKDGMPITVSCAEGDTGYVYDGLLDYDVKETGVDELPELPVKVMLNVGNPNRAFAFHAIPNAGVGLARVEFIISNTIGIHPKALLNYDKLSDELRAEIDARIAGYSSPVEYYVEKLREGIAMIASVFRDKPVIVRLSDFKSNEYANLIGGELYEPHEENPMLGFRGASRYIDDSFKDCFALECQAVKRVREEMGFKHVEVMIPFVRTLNEAKDVIDVLSANGLKRGENDLRIIMMCELPSNAILANQFLDFFDGFSIGSNDLTQLTLGLDRDSGLIAKQFDERDPAVKFLLQRAIEACKARGKYIGICGQGPSDHPDFAEWLMEKGIDSLSLNPDTVIETILFLGEHLKKS